MLRTNLKPYRQALRPIVCAKYALRDTHAMEDHPRRSVMRVGPLWSVQESAHVVAQDTLPQRAVHCAHSAARASVLLLDLLNAHRVRLVISQLLVRSGAHPGAHAR